MEGHSIFFEIGDTSVILAGNSEKLRFKKSDLKFSDGKYINIFSKKNNKTLAETIRSKRYSFLKEVAEEKYNNYLDYGLGVFLLELKNRQDEFYKKFLNKYGDEIYIKFELEPAENNCNGLYIFCKNKELKYVGKTTDSIINRVNNGYGNISPKNCFLDGQSTNCHINSLIAKDYRYISFYYLAMKGERQINDLEADLISKYDPAWNILLKNGLVRQSRKYCPAKPASSSGLPENPRTILIKKPRIL
jgi:hypothetical protein